MLSKAETQTKTIILKALIAARRSDDITLSLELPGDTTLGSLHVACLRAINTQAPEHSGKPIASLQYDVEANT